MPANTTHSAVAQCQPPDHNIKVWRYMDLTRLVAFVQKQALHFARTDTLGDPFEGSLTLRNHIAREQMIMQMWEGQKNDTPVAERATQEELRNMLVQAGHTIKQWVFVSCWHSGETESMAMWKQYGLTSGSIVVQSSYKRLRDTLPSTVCVDKDESENIEIHLGMVRYRNYSGTQQRDLVTLNHNALPAFFHKRTAFAYENEVRAALLYPITGNPSSVYVNVNLEQLVETIRVRPGAHDWERQTVEALIKKYGLRMKVAPSQIDATPMF